MPAWDDSLRQELEAALRGLDYPAPRNKLLVAARMNGAPPEVIDRLAELPETADFVNEEQLRRALGVTVAGERPHGWE
jgi:hypothetical protein